MTPEALAITTTLYLGPPEVAYGRESMIPVQDVSEAMLVIQSGLQALLPPWAWGEAAEVLRRFGASEEHVTFRLQMAGAPPGYPA